ncbi:SDR family NAD(P)-dependent oxidoreductase [Rhodococcus sp. 14-2483-1-2]|uniref:SDR family NAD(P)-dependent oxidoreductase n=1 Tax=Rhodococcus sp. 14-2483-1-2 TaxID=2023147 RepID=UPI000B9A91B0|nr:SDR family NAD(P)-dependent oxidoreductase [Rhodococcus sp. 14-2483-1-2]OZF26068.1 hypothetical protein CH295_25905 [Rhodococcus sp. 14-2483-1-2]
MNTTDAAVAVVTGGGSGIGAAVAHALSARGDRVAIADIDIESAAAVARTLDPTGSRATAVHFDVTDERSVLSGIADITSRWGRIDTLVNAAGIADSDIAERLSLDTWNRVLATNLTGTFLASRAVLPVMRQVGGGAVVTIASIAAKRISYNGGVAYTAAKAGVLGLTRHLAFEAAVDQVRVNAVCPGPTETPLMADLDPEVVAARKASVPLGRLALPSDIAEAVLFLSSPGSVMITGEALDVDGGSLLAWYDIETYFNRRGGRP